jgi:uncharacterized protein
MNTLALKSIEFYQRFLSPLLGGRCRFHPSCSQYAHGCFERLGFFPALARTTWRLLKCQPLHPGGVDPVPGGGMA